MAHLSFQTCRLLKECKGKGLHCHHPRDCFYYLRDNDTVDLQALLKVSIDYCIGNLGNMNVQKMHIFTCTILSQEFSFPREQSLRVYCDIVAFYSTLHTRICIVFV